MTPLSPPRRMLKRFLGVSPHEDFWVPSSFFPSPSLFLAIFGPLDVTYNSALFYFLEPCLCVGLDRAAVLYSPRDRVFRSIACIVLPMLSSMSPLRCLLQLPPLFCAAAVLLDLFQVFGANPPLLPPQTSFPTPFAHRLFLAISLFFFFADENMLSFTGRI